MDPYKLALRDGEKPEGVIVAQVGLYGKRQLGYILYTADIAGLYAKRIEFIFVERNVFIHALYGFYKPFGLKRGHLFPRCRFGIGFKYRHYNTPPLT